MATAVNHPPILERKPPEGAITVVPPHDSMLAIIERAVMSPEFDVDKLAALLALRERMEANQARQAFVQAMAKFKENPPFIAKDKTATIRSRKGEGSSFSYKYAPLDTVCHAVTKALSAVGISHRWVIDDSVQDVIKVSCVLTHEMGHSEETSMRAPVVASEFVNIIQSRAIVVSYLERYTLFASTGLAAGDTDRDGDTSTTTNGNLSEQVEWIKNARNVDELRSLFEQAYKLFAGNPNAQRVLIQAKDARKKEL